MPTPCYHRVGVPWIVRIPGDASSRFRRPRTKVRRQIAPAGIEEMIRWPLLGGVRRPGLNASSVFAT